jgi:hypothetical protein
MPKARVRVNGQWYDIGGFTQQDKDTIDKQMSDNLSASKAYADGLNATTNQTVGAMQSSLTNTRIFFDQYSADGIIYDSEMTPLQGYLTAMDLAKTNLDVRYNTIYGSPNLVDSGTSTPKSSLYNADQDFNSKYDALVAAINNVITDTRVDSNEKAQVDSLLDSANTSLTSLSTAFQNAITAIADKQAQLYASGVPTDGLIGTLSDTIEHHSASISQNSQSIETKVDSTTYDNHKVQDNWYNFVKSNTPNMFGDIEAIVPPSPYTWMVGTLPDGSQGTVLDKKYTAGGAVDTTEWLMPQVAVNPSKPYLLEFWVKAFDTNSSYYFGREEYSDDGSGGLVFNDQVGGCYVSENVTATSDTVGTWVKHYAVIPPYNTGPLNDHTTVQSSYTPDFDYKFWNSSTAYIKPKIYLTHNAQDTTKDSEMQAWGFGLYEIGSKVNLYAQVESLNKSMTSAQSSITQNATDITLRVTTTTYNTTISGINTQISDTNSRIDLVEQKVPYYLEILSSNGSVFKNGDISTVLSATLYNGTDDVTGTVDASRFIWTRASSDTAGDTAWNNAHATGTKTITITPSDINVKAVFQCSISNV